MAKDYERPVCGELRRGEQMMPAARISLIPSIWSCCGIDALEHFSRCREAKAKCILYINMASRLAVADVIHVDPARQSRNESAKEFIRSFSSRWLADKPMLAWCVCDDGGAFKSHMWTGFLNDNLFGGSLTRAQSPWAHGEVERMVQTIKRTCLAIRHEQQSLDMPTCLALAVAAHNSLERVRGYSPLRWAYGVCTEYVEE